MTPTPRRSQRSYLVAIWTLTALALLIPMDAEATVMRYADLERLVEISDVIVHGTVADTDTYLDDGAPWTATTVDITHAFVGDVGEQITFEQWGGEADGKRGRIPGDPRLKPDQEVVVFLRHDHQRQSFALSGFGQAVYFIRQEGELRFAQRDLSELSFVVRDETGSRVIHHGDPPRQWSVFVDILEGLLGSEER